MKFCIFICFSNSFFWSFLYAWEASWGKVLTLDQLKRKGYALASWCVLCEKDEETVDHILVHCSKARMLWDIMLTLCASFGQFA